MPTNWPDDVVKPGNRPGTPDREYVRKAVLNPDQILNRHGWEPLCFANRSKLRQLERIIHPRVAREQQRLVRRIAKRKPHAVVIYEVPLLFEAGVDKRVDTTIVVTADRDTQIARLKKRNGLSRAEALRRISSQMPLAKKIQRADHVLNGTLPRLSLRKQVGQLFRSLRLFA